MHSLHGYFERYIAAGVSHRPYTFSHTTKHTRVDSLLPTIMPLVSHSDVYARSHFYKTLLRGSRPYLKRANALFGDFAISLFIFMSYLIIIFQYKFKSNFD